MSSIATLVRVPSVATASPARPLPQVAFPGKLLASLPASRDRYGIAMAAVTALHMAALVWLLQPSENPQTMQPVLAFSVTLMDLSSAPSSISAAASAASTPAAKPTPDKLRETPKPQVKAATKKQETVKPLAVPTPSVNTPLSHNSQQQAAVMAPITPAQYNAAYLQNPAPGYPPLSRRMGEQGIVMVSAYVTADGRAESVRLKQSSGFNRLDSAALEAVAKWRFAAARQGEQLLASWVQVPINFKLE